MIHLNFFTSLFLYAVMLIISQTTITQKLFESASPEAGGADFSGTIQCRLVYTLTMYLRLCNYCWMFCEGLFLVITPPPISNEPLSSSLPSYPFCFPRSSVIWSTCSWAKANSSSTLCSAGVCTGNSAENRHSEKWERTIKYWYVELQDWNSKL